MSLGFNCITYVLGISKNGSLSYLGTHRYIDSHHSMSVYLRNLYHNISCMLTYKNRLEENFFVCTDLKNRCSLTLFGLIQSYIKYKLNLIKTVACPTE